MSGLVILSLVDSWSLKWQRWEWDRVHSNFWSVHCPLPVCHSPRHSNRTGDGFCVPSALRFQSSDFANTEYTICIPYETFCAVVSHPKPNSVHWYLGLILFAGSVVICFASTFSPNGTDSCVGFLPCSLSNGIFPSRPFWHLDRMHPACSTNHGRTGALNVTLDGSDDSTQQHHRVLDELIRLLCLPSPRLQW